MPLLLIMVVMLMVQADGEDELKKMQLMELAIMNGTYREALPQAGATFVVNTPRTIHLLLLRDLLS